MPGKNLPRIFLASLGLCLAVFSTAVHGQPDPLSLQTPSLSIDHLTAGVTMVGRKRIHPHHLSHSFAVEAARNIESAADLKKLQELMEPNSIKVTEGYLKFGSSDRRRILNRMWSDRE